VNAPGTPLWLPWALAGVLVVGAVGTSKVLDQRIYPLRAPLETAVPALFATLPSEDVELSDIEVEVAGVTDYLMRVYQRTGTEAAADAAGAPWMSVYVGFYESQTRGKTIHSPKNCMPGSGWEALASRTVAIQLPGGGQVEVNRYLLVNEGQRVLVLYWYQGRGRVVASEYRAKWDLLRDASLRRRSDEALVRIVVPVVGGDEEDAFAAARDLARRLLPTLSEALPAA